MYTGERIHKLRTALAMAVGIVLCAGIVGSHSAVYGASESASQADLPEDFMGQGSLQQWQITLEDGAEGSWSYDGAYTRGYGSGSLRLTKTSGRGYILIRSRNPITVQPKKEYRFGCYFHAKDAPVLSFLLMRVSPEGSALAYNSRVDTSKGYTGQSLLCNTPPGRWERRMMTLQSDDAQQVHIRMVLYGNPCTVWIDDIDYTTERFTINSAPVDYQEIPYTRDQAMKILDERSPATARLKHQDDRTFFLLDGSVVAPTMYKGAPEIDRHYPQAFHEAGIDLCSVAVTLGKQQNKEHARIYEPGGQFLWNVLHDRLDITLRRNPHAHIVLNFITGFSHEWGHTHPDDIWQDHQGKYAYTSLFNVNGFTDDIEAVNREGRKRRGSRWWDMYLYPSYHSRAFEDEMAQAIVKVVEYLQQTPYHKAIVGCIVDGGVDGQFIPDSSRYDYSPVAVQAFRQWCRSHYQSIANLNRAWHTEYDSFDQVEVPSPRNGPDNADKDYQPAYLGGGPHVDYYQFRHEDGWRMKNHWATEFKKTIGKDVIALTYASHGYLNRGLAASSAIDICSELSYYPYRYPGYSIDLQISRTPLHFGKMIWQEMDVRSWVGSCYPQEVKQRWIGAGRSPERWRTTQRKLLGTSLDSDTGNWYYCMNNYYRDHRIIDNIDQATDILTDIWTGPARSMRPDVAVVISDQAILHYGNSHRTFGPRSTASFWQIMQLRASGVPYDVYELEDVLSRPELQDYKVYMFFDTPAISAQQRRQIEHTLKNNDRWLVWSSACGYATEHTLSTAAMSSLIGMKIHTDNKRRRDVVLVDADAHEITEDALPFQGTSEAQAAVMNMHGSTLHMAGYINFWVADESATTLARYAVDNRTAMALRTFDGWTSVYQGQPYCIGPALFNAIARQAGAFVWGASGQTITGDDRLCCVHGLRDGVYTINLPEGTHRVIDLDTGIVLADNVTTYDLPVRCQNTYWLTFR